ncbi:MAG: phosphotransferase [Acidobacteriota bacterium]
MAAELQKLIAALIERGLVDVAAIVEGDLKVSDAARRNRNQRLERRRGPSYLIKRPEEGKGRMLAAEAGFYSLCRKEARAAAVARFVPRLFAYHPEEPLLAIELLQGARPLWQEYESHSEAGFPIRPAQALGQVLGTVHATFRSPGLAAGLRLGRLPSDPPLFLSLHQPGVWILRRLSPARRRILRILQNEEGLSLKLSALLPEWRSETLIHGDIRSDNVLVMPQHSEARAQIQLVDWESAQLGDPAWDIAGALQDFILFWIFGMPQSKELSARERASRSTRPLALLQPALRAFWGGYRDAAGLETRQAGELLLRSVRFSAARLIQSAYEHSRGMDRLTVSSVLMLQTVSNILADPLQAALQLYGFWPETVLATASRGAGPGTGSEPPRAGADDRI